ncbi:MAG: oligosaccharide flippase family protein [Clostridia bacterium]|nr:oligosaccharide flippase family protein [Clostridia bacterium]
MKEKKNNLFKSFIEYFYGNFVVLLLGFISLPLVTRVLDTEEYGRTSIFTSVVSIIYIFAILGLDQAYIRYFYKKEVNQYKLLNLCIRLPILIVTFLSAAYFFCSDFFNELMFEKSGMDVTLLVISYTMISVIERFMFLNIRMEQNGKLYSNLNIVSKVLNVSCLILFAFFMGNDFRVVLYAMTISLGIVTLYVTIRYILRYLKSEERNREHQVSQKELLQYGTPFITMLLMEWLLTSMDKWSIRIFCDFTEVGIYSSAMQIMTIILTFKITFVAFWSPVAMEKYENENEETSKAFFKDVFRKVQFLCIAAAVCLTVFRSLIVLILGKSYREAVTIIPFLSLMPILSILFEMVCQGIKFVGKIKYINYASIAAIICNLLGNTLLVPVLGGKGAAIATALTYIVYFLIGTYFSEKCYAIGYQMKIPVISLLLYCIYAGYATFIGDDLISVLSGILLLGIICFINRQVLSDLVTFAKSFLSRLKTSDK